MKIFVVCIRKSSSVKFFTKVTLLYVYSECITIKQQTKEQCKKKKQRTPNFDTLHLLPSPHIQYRLTYEPVQVFYAKYQGKSSSERHVM